LVCGCRLGNLVVLERKQMNVSKRKVNGERTEPVPVASSTLVDYTTWRAGRITPKGRKIVKCAKCGRNGELSSLNNATGVMSITHTAKQETGAGLSWLLVKDCCSYKEGE